MKELFAIWQGLLAFAPLVRDAHVELQCDNLPAVHMLRKLNTRSWPCRAQVLRILRTCTELRVFLAVFWVKSADNLADAPSRARLNSLYTLPPWVSSLVRQ